MTVTKTFIIYREEIYLSYLNSNRDLPGRNGYIRYRITQEKIKNFVWGIPVIASTEEIKSTGDIKVTLRQTVLTDKNNILKTPAWFLSKKKIRKLIW